MIKIIDAKTITEKKKKTAKKDAKTMIADGEKMRPMTYDEACASIKDLKKENDAIKKECTKLKADFNKIVDKNAQLEKKQHDLLAEKAEIKNNFQNIKSQLSNTIKDQLNQLSEKEKLFNATLDIAVVHNVQRKRYKCGFFAVILLLIAENLSFFFGSYIQTWIDLLR